MNVLRKGKNQKPGKRFSFPKNFLIIPLLFTGLSLNSCMTMGDYNFSHIDANLASGKYLEARSELDLSRLEIYGPQDQVLEALDFALLSHYAWDIKESNTNFSQAEKLIDSYSAKSISQAVASFISNDMIQDYAGEDYENIYTNIFMALNYIQLGQIDDAMVEIRRFDNKLKVIRSNYEKTVEQANESKNEDRIEKSLMKFHDSALARYLSMLLYIHEGDSDNARVDYKYIQKAFSSQKTLYDFDMPGCIQQELSAPKNNTRLSVLAFSGKAPVKIEETSRFYSIEGSVWYQLALPEMRKRPSQITDIQVKAVKKDALSSNDYSKAAGTTIQAEKLESIENIAMDTFRQHYSLIKAKAITRSIAKTATNSTIHALSQSDELGSGGQLLFTMLDLTTKIANAASERADVRCCRYFPATASVASLNLQEGDYIVTVSYCKGTRVLYEDVQEVNIKKGKLNFLESACLR